VKQYEATNRWNGNLY